VLAQNGLDGNAVAETIIEAVLKGFLLAWPIWALIGAMVALRIVIAVYRRWRLASSGIYEIDRLSGAVFEQYLELLFRRLGWRVERTRAAGDYGGDLVVSRDGARTVVQAKRYSKPVGVRAVQEVVAAKRAYDCTEAMVVTNSRFTKQAAHLAGKNDVELWDRDVLVRQLTAAGGRGRLRRQHAAS
jgi:restriction system protein